MMKKSASIILWLALLCGCARTTETVRTLDEAESLLTEHPDSAKNILASLDRRSLRPRRNRARFALLYSQALDKSYIDVDCDTLTRIATDFYRHRGAPGDRAKACFYRGRVYENAGKADSAIVFFTQAEQYAQKTDDCYLKGLIANALAGMYAAQGFTEPAKEKYLKSSEYFRQIKYKKNVLSNYIGIIGIISLEKNYTEREHYLNLSDPIAIELQDTSKLLFLARSWANLIIDRDENYSQALTILHKAIHRYINDDALPNAYRFMMANLYVKLNRPDSARLHLAPLVETMAVASARSRMEILYLQSKIYGLQGQYKQAQSCGLQALHICDSLYFAEKEQAIPELKAKYQNDQLILRNRYLRKITVYQSYTALAVLVAIVSGSLWLINRRQRKILQQKQEIAEYSEAISRLKNEYEILQSQYNGKQEGPALDESMLARRIHFLKQILDITSNFKHDKEKFHEKIESLFTKNGQGKKEPNEIFLMFQDLLEMRRPGIIDFIRKRYPSITTQEMALYCMICMDVSKSAICLVLGNKQKTYYNYRNVLRSKLNITYDDMTIQEHFQSMCAAYAEQEKS